MTGQSSKKARNDFLSNKIFMPSSSPKIFYESEIFDRNILSKLLLDQKKILLVSEKKIWRNCKKFFSKSFTDSISKILLLGDKNNLKADEKNLKTILKIADQYQLIIAVGSGTINDLCKLTSAQLKIPYLVFPSAASMNGYLSKNASITISGHKKTLQATLPIAVFCNLKMLANAPSALTKAGIGDAMCFYSCWFDWYLSHLVLNTEFNEKPFNLLQNKIDFLLKNFQKFSTKDEEFLKILFEILLLSGLGMTMCGGSYPASQSEHLIAHALEMKYPKKLKKVFHGSQIAITTLTSSEIQQDLLNRDILRVEKDKFPTKEIEKFFGKKISLECKKEFAQKTLSDNEVREINKNLAKNWDEFRQKLQKIHLNQFRLKQVFSHFKISISHKSLGLSVKEYQDCVASARFIRNRFTCLDFH